MRSESPMPLERQATMIPVSILPFRTLYRCKGQPPVNLAHRFSVAFAVITDLGKLSRAVIGIDFGVVETLFGRRNAQRAGQKIETNVLATPFAPLVHRVVHRSITEAGERDLAGRVDLVNDRTLIDEPKIEV